MTTSVDDERWIDVLSGRMESADAAGREALGYRKYLERYVQEEQAEIDDVAYLRTMNYLRARGAFEGRPAMPQRAGKWRTMIDSLRFPGQPGGRAAFVATLMLAVLVVPLVLREPVDSPQMKRLPPLTAAEENVVIAADPMQEARSIQAALIMNGVESDIEPGEAQLLLTATVGAEDMEAAREALQQFGVALPSDGRLRILVRRP